MIESRLLCWLLSEERNWRRVTCILYCDRGDWETNLLVERSVYHLFNCKHYRRVACLSKQLVTASGSTINIPMTVSVSTSCGSAMEELYSSGVLNYCSLWQSVAHILDGSHSRLSEMRSQWTSQMPSPETFNAVQKCNEKWYIYLFHPW